MTAPLKARQPSDDPLATFERRLFDMAEAHRQAMRAMSGGEAMRYIDNIVDSNDLVFGVFPDINDPRGFGAHIIKGRRELNAISSSGGSETMRMGAVPCCCLEQAFDDELTISGSAPKSN